MASRRNGIDRNEFRGNYTLATRAELEAIIAAHREGRLGKDRMRVFAAMLEKRALHARSRVDMHRIVNAKRSKAHTLSRGRIERIEQDLVDMLARAPERGRRVPVSRKMVKHIAAGQASPSDAIVLLYYCLRRMKQRRRMERLREEERYARFRYADLAALSGCGRSTICRAVERLRSRGYLQTLEIQKLNENAYGCLFADGPLVSLTSQAGRERRGNGKPTTRSSVSDNAPGRFSTTPENGDPKTEILNRRGFSFAVTERDGVLVAMLATPSTTAGLRGAPVASAPTRARCPEFRRIQERARQIRESFAEAVA